MVYVLSCRDTSLYIGITNDIEKRVRAHNAGTGGRYTRSRRPVSLAFVRACRSATFARRLEVALKKLDRRRRLRLIAGDRDVLALALADVARMSRAARGRLAKQRARKLDRK